MPSLAVLVRDNPITLFPNRADDAARGELHRCDRQSSREEIVSEPIQVPAGQRISVNLIAIAQENQGIEPGAIARTKRYREVTEHATFVAPDELLDRHFAGLFTPW